MREWLPGSNQHREEEQLQQQKGTLQEIYNNQKAEIKK